MLRTQRRVGQGCSAPNLGWVRDARVGQGCSAPNLGWVGDAPHPTSGGFSGGSGMLRTQPRVVSRVGPGCSAPCPALPCPPCPALPCPALPSPPLPCPAALPCPALPCLPCPALPCPALPCPALPALPCPALPCPWPALPCPVLARREALTGRGSRLFVGNLLFVERPAQAARTHNPTPIHLSCALLCLVAYILNWKGSREQESPP